MKHGVFLFGEAEKGAMCVPCSFHSLIQLMETFGQPPHDTLGIYYAVQVLLYQHELIFFRVREEGLSLGDYMKGLKALKRKDFAKALAALCLPNVSDARLIEEAGDLCSSRHWFLITAERDLYDYLTAEYANRKAG